MIYSFYYDAGKARKATPMHNLYETSATEKSLNIKPVLRFRTTPG